LIIRWVAALAHVRRGLSTVSPARKVGETVRRCISVAVMVLVAASVTALAGGLQTPAVTVTWDGSPNRWSTPNDSSANKKGTIGDVTGRMQVPVANGDVVAFVVNSGTHHVIFENAKKKRAGKWRLGGRRRLRHT
jgi:plastocyanin